MNSTILLIIATVIYLLGIGVYNIVMLPSGFGFTRNSWLPTAFFGTLSIILVSAYNSIYNIGWPDVVDTLPVLFLVYILFFAVSLLVNLKKRKNIVTHQVGLTRFSYKYIISKSFEVLFQQLTFWLMIISLRESLVAISVIISFSIWSGLIHAPLILYHKWKGVFFTVAATVGSWIFAFVVLNIDHGYAYSFLLHMGFYALAALIYNMFPAYFKRYRKVIKL